MNWRLVSDFKPLSSCYQSLHSTKRWGSKCISHDAYNSVSVFTKSFLEHRPKWPALSTAIQATSVLTQATLIQ